MDIPDKEPTKNNTPQIIQCRARPYKSVDSLKINPLVASMTYQYIKVTTKLPNSEQSYKLTFDLKLSRTK